MTLAMIILITVGGLRHSTLIMDYRTQRVVMIVWTVLFLLTAVQWVLSWFERPFTGWSSRLSRLVVVVNIPVRNEDPATLDRGLYALSRQTRLPDHVQVVDDCSDQADYRKVRDFWCAHPVLGPRLSWVRKDINQGKKHAQAATVRDYPEADIFITTDSDTCLPRNAIEEGLRPFRSRDVYSVAGNELAWNQSYNWLTLMTASRVMTFQMVTCAAQNVAGGDILVNRGPFALYRADLVRDILPAYLDETFMGRPVRLGDDAALTLFARGRGRAVQQPTAFCYAVYPQSLGHHFRQWTRWMRGSTIRNCWRLRYLPFSSWGWWYTVINTWTFFMGLVVPVAVLATWPTSEMYTLSAAGAAALWACCTSLRSLTVRRGDHSWLHRWALVLMAPVAALWVLLILRPVRLYGIFTCLRQGWVTRNQVEVSEEAPAPAVRAAPVRAAPVGAGPADWVPRAEQALL